MRTEKTIRDRIEHLKAARKLAASPEMHPTESLGKMQRIDAGIRTLQWVLGELED